MWKILLRQWTFISSISQEILLERVKWISFNWNSFTFIWDLLSSKFQNISNFVFMEYKWLIQIKYVLSINSHSFLTQFVFLSLKYLFFVDVVHSCWLPFYLWYFVSASVISKFHFRKYTSLNKIYVFIFYFHIQGIAILWAPFLHLCWLTAGCLFDQLTWVKAFLQFYNTY